MFRLHRLLLIWLVALALPLQGMAAALRLGCLPGQAVSLAQQPGHGPHAPALGAGHGGHAAGAAQHGAGPSHHGHAAAHASPAAPAQADTSAAAPERLPLPASAHSCSACAACCLGAVLLAPELSPALVLPLAHSLVFQALQVGPVRFVTGGPDRPPRSQPA